MSFVRCTKTIDIDPPEHIPLPVINSLFCPNDTIKVYLTSSSSPYSSMPEKITDATILLYENETLVDTMMYDTSGFYISKIFPQENYEYKLKSNIVGYKDCSAIDKVPIKPVLSSVTFQDSVLVDDEGFYLSKAEITIIDSDTESNYYELSMNVKYQIDWGIGGIKDYIESILFSQSRNNDPVLIDSGLLPYKTSKLLFTDNLFNGQQYKMTIYYYDLSNQWGSNYSDYSLIVNLKSVSKNYYNYCKKLYEYNYTPGTLFESGYWELGDPVTLYSNIVNGYGIFASYSYVSDTIPKE